MIELFVVVGLCKQLGALVRKKGRRPFWYQLLMVLAWVGGELVGGVATVIILAIANPEEVPPVGFIYLGALITAGVWVGFVFLLANGLPNRSEHERPSPLDYVHDNSPLTPDTGNPYQPPMA